MTEVPEAVLRYGERYGSFMLNPLRRSRTCAVCLTFCRAGFDRCYPCGHMPQRLAAVLPISYSVEREQLHRALMTYKGRSVIADSGTQRHAQFELAAVLWRFLAAHEHCAAAAAGVEGFPVVSVVPSGRGVTPQEHPLTRIVGDHVALTRDRFVNLLVRSSIPLGEHEYDERRFEPIRDLDGEPVLLVEDTWTQGAQAQSAAAALLSAGSGAVACVVVGRHIHRDYEDNGELLADCPDVFDWDLCALHERHSLAAPVS